MPVPENAMDELENALLQLQEQGYLKRVREGDARAASLAVRLAVYTCNPDGKPAGWGWLKKGGGKNIDGYAEDAAVYGNGPELDNVCDCIVGAGQAGAHIGLQRKHRRDSDKWHRPQPLTSGDLNYLKAGSGQGGNPQVPTGKVTIPEYESFGGDRFFWDKIGGPLGEDYARRQSFDPGASVWFGRVFHRVLRFMVNDGMTIEQAVDKAVKEVRPEWRAALGTPEGGWS